MNYDQFLDSKAQLGGDHGFAPVWTPDFLFDFQASLVNWATRKGRGAIFADCGLGKTAMELVWAENVVRHAGPVLLLPTPSCARPERLICADAYCVRWGT